MADAHPSPNSTSSDANPSRILIVRPSALGDVCRTVPVLVTLRNAHPDARIDWLVNDAFVDAIAAHPALDEAIPFARKRFAGMLTKPKVFAEFRQYCSMLRLRGYDMVLDLQGLFRSAWLTRVTGAKKRIGFANARELGWLMYNRRHNLPTNMHTVDRMLAVLEGEGYETSQDTSLYVSEADRDWLNAYRTQMGGADEPYVCVAPTAQWVCKCWPLEKYAALCKQLAADGRAGKRFVVIAAPHERQAVQPLLDELKSVASVDCPQTSIGQMLALLSEARLVLCNDSGPLHAAVGFDRPIVSFFGPTLVSEVGPYQRDDSVVVVPNVDKRMANHYRRNKQDQSLIDQIDVATAWAKLQEQLAR